MKIAINCKKPESIHLKFISELILILNKKNIGFIINEDIENFDTSNFNTYNYTTNINDITFFVSVGGDGTLLNTATYIANKKTPILGVNAGRLGFLTTSTTENLEKTIIQLQNNEYEIEKRTLINLSSSVDYFDDLNFALNEVAILKQDSSSMITIKVKRFTTCCYIN